jgi:tetratricopeptide (TPR) repeat protein
MTLKIKDRLMGLMLLLAMAGGPTLPAIAGGACQARSEQSDRDEEAQIRAAIQQDPKHPSAFGIDPNNDEYYIKLGNILKNRGESDAAIEAYKTAINLKLKPNHRSSLNQAMGYELISDYLRAQGEVNAAAAARDKSAAILCKIERSCPSLIEGKAVEAVPQPRVRSTYPSVPFRGRDILRERLRGSPSVKIKHIYNF